MNNTVYILSVYTHVEFGFFSICLHLLTLILKTLTFGSAKNISNLGSIKECIVFRIHQEHCKTQITNDTLIVIIVCTFLMLALFF